MFAHLLIYSQRQPYYNLGFIDCVYHIVNITSNRFN